MADDNFIHILNIYSKIITYFKVYYEVCPETIRNLVHYSQTVTGAEAHSIIAVYGKCVQNAVLAGKYHSILIVRRLISTTLFIF